MVYPCHKGRPLRSTPVGTINKKPLVSASGKSMKKTSFLVMEALDARESGGIECGIARAPLSALRLGDDGRICL